MKKPIMFAGIAAVALLAVGYFVLLPMFKGKPAAAAADDDEPVAAAAAHTGSSAAAKKKKPRAAEPGLVYPMAERILNLASAGGQAHYARIELALEFEKPKDAKAAAPKKAEGAGKEAPLDPALEPVAARKAGIDDLVLRIVGGKTFEQMTTNDGREELKQEILNGVLDLVPAPEITSVYIVRLVVQ